MLKTNPLYTVLVACVGLFPAASPASELLFASGFEGGVTIGPLSEGYRTISGTDSATGYSWPVRILGASESALHPIVEEGGTIGSDLRMVTGRNGTPTRVLYSVETGTPGVTQMPYEILNIRDGRSDLYVRYWIKLDPASLDAKDSWRSFFEWKSKGYGEGRGFRLISFIYTDPDGRPYWHWQGDLDPQNAVWEIDNREVPVPVNEWFLTEFYWHWSDGSDGRALWKINGQVVGDHYGPTTRNGEPVDFIMLTQIYGDANPKAQWIDDIEIWSGLPETQ